MENYKNIMEKINKTYLSLTIDFESEENKSGIAILLLNEFDEILDWGFCKTLEEAAAYLLEIEEFEKNLEHFTEAIKEANNGSK